MSSNAQPVQSIFLAVVEKSDSDRAQILDRECGGNSDLRRRVEALLRAHDAPESFLDSPPSATTAAPDITEQPGTQIGPYKLLQQIGEGGMGVVYMAEQKDAIQRHVALKIIKPGMDSRQVLARFEVERQSLALMEHPNIARVLDAGSTDNGRPYFVMELVKGIPINKYCDEHDLDTSERLTLFKSVCHAIQHAHQKGIIHRDIKPSNILVAEFDNQPIPKVIDFGVAKAISQRLTERTMFTQLGQIVGTLEYMSPEQAKLNQLDVDTRSDVYSLGVLLYELLTGTTPIEKQQLQSAAFEELLRIIREEQPPRPSIRLSTINESASIAKRRKSEPKKLSLLLRGELDWVVMKALEKERANRYDSASGLADDVERFLKGDAVVACPPSRRYLLRKTMYRHRVAIATTALVLLVSILGTAGTSTMAFRAARAEKAAREHAQQLQESLDRVIHLSVEQAIIHAMSGKHDKAKNIIQSIPDPNIQKYWEHVVGGLSSLFDGKTKVAIQRFETATAMEAEVSKTASEAMLVAAYVYDGDSPRCGKQFLQVKNAECHNDLDHFFLGQAYLWYDAVAAEDIMGDLYNDTAIGRVVHAEAKAHRAQANHKIELLREAHEDMEVAEKLIPNNPYVYQIGSYISVVGYQIGWANDEPEIQEEYLALGRRYADHLTPHFPDNKICLAFAARFYALVDDNEQATDTWQSAYRQGLRGFWLAECLHHLERLGQHSEALAIFKQLETPTGSEVLRYAMFLDDSNEATRELERVCSQLEVPLAIAALAAFKPDVANQANAFLQKDLTSYEKKILEYVVNGIVPSEGQQTPGKDTRDVDSASVYIAMVMIRDGRINEAKDLLNRVDKTAGVGQYLWARALEQRILVND